MRAITNNPPQTSAVRLQTATHSGEYGVSPVIPTPTRPAERMAAVAESAPTTSSFDDPRRAKAIVGKITVYRPVIRGVWDIEVYPMTSGMATAASVNPATMSVLSQAGR